MLMLMGNTRAGWCLTADNRLERRGGDFGVDDNRQGDVKLVVHMCVCVSVCVCMCVCVWGGVWRESEVE